MHALVIDDSRAMRMLLSRMLRDAGFEVSEAGNGQEALDQLNEAGPVDFCLVDWNMPVMNGFDFLRTVRSEGRYDTMRLVMVTTETEISQMIRALDAGANEYVMKPFTKEVIFEKLDLLGMGQRQ